ncbi:MAG TPA: hypothetical protein VHG28_09945, partial [Longimicrobiaceae bacterium]|nr:hypothetical protein [Longimicrobiaceae bacterium]
MKTRTLFLAAAGLALLHAAPARAQAIRAGMSEAEVRSRLGAPDVVRESDGWRYLFYANGCAIRCGSDDVVFLRDGRVVTAVFRTRQRRFVGEEASEALEGFAGARGAAERPPAGAAPGRAVSPERGAGQARVEGIRVTVPGTERADPGGFVIVPGGARGDTLLADTALDQTARERERNVTERTIPPGNRQS